MEKAIPIKAETHIAIAIIPYQGGDNHNANSITITIVQNKN